MKVGECTTQEQIDEIIRIRAEISKLKSRVKELEDKIVRQNYC